MIPPFCPTVSYAHFQGQGSGAPKHVFCEPKELLNIQMCLFFDKQMLEGTEESTVGEKMKTL